MTYCIGLLLNQGLVMIADTRTNAGVDNFSSYKKLHTLAATPDRQIFACTSGSLSMSQSVISLIQEGLPSADGGGLPRTLANATSMFRVAQLVGEAVQVANRTVGNALDAINLNSSVSLLLGGRIGKTPPALFQIYTAGNFIQCKPESPFLQIGETKYGKPILDRGIEIDMPLDEAAKVAFLSLDSAMRSNLGVAPARHDRDGARSQGADLRAPDRVRRRIFQRIVAALVGAAPRGDAGHPQSALHAARRGRCPRRGEPRRGVTRV